MKKVLFVLFSVFILSGCSDSETQPVNETDKSEEEETKKTEEEPNQEENENDGLLTEVGQIINKDLYTVELLAIKDVNETIDLDPIKLTIEDIKIIRMSDIQKEERIYLDQFTDKENFDYIQIKYSMDNTIDETIDFISPISHLVLDTGEQIDVNRNDFMLHPNNQSSFYGTVTKEAGISAIIDKSSVDDINTIKIITGMVMNEPGEILSDEEEITYELD